MFKKLTILLVLPVLLLTGCTKENNEQEIGVAFPDARWTVVSDFAGYQTKNDPTKVQKGANPQGQNTTANERDRISIRDIGYEVFPSSLTASTTIQKINSVHTFRRRDGENIMIRTRDTVMEYFEEGTDVWTVFRTDLTDDKRFGFADYNINTDVQSQVYFGNAFDNAARWTGVHDLINGAVSLGAATVVVDDISGFANSGSIVYCATSTAYSSISTVTNTFTLTGTSSVACADDQGLSQAVTEYATAPKGNIYLASSNRIFIAGIVTTTQAVFFSEYGDATNYLGASLIDDSTDTSPGIFNLGLGGGAVTGMVQDEGSIYMMKRSIIRKATLNDTIYTLSTLKPFDGKGQTVGSLSDKGIFTGGNAVYFPTSDNQIMELLRVETIDYPQMKPISDIIKPTVDEFNFDDAAGIVFRDKAYFAVKSNTTVTQNDTVLVWNIDKKIWDSPIVGWRVSDFVVYDDGTSEELYYADAISPNIYKVIASADDNGFDVKANWRSKQFTFGAPHAQKQIVDMFVEGYIAENTTLFISLLLDEDGFTETFSTELEGTDETYIYDSSEFNSFGLSAFGTQRFGSQEDLSGKKKFRVYLGKDFRPSPFYNIQVEFASEAESSDWEVLSFGMKVRPYSTPEKRQLYKSFK